MINFVEYNVSTGEISRFGAVPPEAYDVMSIPEGYAVIAVEGRRNAKVNLQTLMLEDVDVMSLPAEWGEIKQLRNQKEQEPITVTGFGTFDIDALSLQRMQIALESFNDLPSVSGGILQWKRADNTYIGLSNSDLQTVYAECKRLVAIRAATLFTRAEELFAQGKTRNDVQDSANWV